MPDRTFASVVPRVLTSAPGCPQPLVVQHIRDAAIRVCERSLMWRYQVPLFNLTPGVPEYFFDKPVTTDVHAVFAAHVNGSPLEVLTLEQAARAYPRWVDLYNGLSAQELWAQSETPHTFNEDEYNETVFNANSTFVLPAAATEGGSDPGSSRR